MRQRVQARIIRCRARRQCDEGHKGRIAGARAIPKCIQRQNARFNARYCLNHNAQTAIVGIADDDDRQLISGRRPNPVVRRRKCARYPRCCTALHRRASHQLPRALPLYRPVGQTVPAATCDDDSKRRAGLQLSSTPAQVNIIFDLRGTVNSVTYRRWLFANFQKQEIVNAPPTLSVFGFMIPICGYVIPAGTPERRRHASRQGPSVLATRKPRSLSLLPWAQPPRSAERRSRGSSLLEPLRMTRYRQSPVGGPYCL